MSLSLQGSDITIQFPSRPVRLRDSATILSLYLYALYRRCQIQYKACQRDFLSWKMLFSVLEQQTVQKESSSLMLLLNPLPPILTRAFFHRYNRLSELLQLLNSHPERFSMIPHQEIRASVNSQIFTSPRPANHDRNHSQLHLWRRPVPFKRVLGPLLWTQYKDPTPTTRRAQMKYQLPHTL